MARFRLRLLLQEFDLPPGETVLGRSPECHVTIDDSLVSREHAKILVEGDRVVLKDLGSRNGSKVNGQVVHGERELQDADRLRIGNQELVFSKVIAPRRPGRPTGSLRVCRKCGNPYAAESPSCPNCGHVPNVDETLSGNMPVTPLDRQQWSIQLQLELLNKAVSLRRTEDATRVMERIATALNEWMTANVDPIESRHFEPAVEGALAFAKFDGGPRWVRWCIEILAKAKVVPSAAIVEQLSLVPFDILAPLNGPMSDLVNTLSLPGGEPSASLEALRELATRLHDLPSTSATETRDDGSGT